MTIETIRDILMWCSVINVGLLIISFLILSMGRQRIYEIHSKWFPMGEEPFKTVMYSIFGVYKILIFIFNLVPYLAVSIVMG